MLEETTPSLFVGLQRPDGTGDEVVAFCAERLAENEDVFGSIKNVMEGGGGFSVCRIFFHLMLNCFLVALFFKIFPPLPPSPSLF